MPRLDKFVETATRTVARGTSRRSMFAHLGAFIAGTTAIPLLPVAHAAEPFGRATNTHGMPPEATGTPQDPGDPTTCEYWRYCGIDGSLCSCCGGTVSSCPPGTEQSPITWIGTCRNPADGRNYIISYNDCCGKTDCNRCSCNNNIGERPLARPQRNNTVIWCLGTQSQTYHCSTAIIVGVATEQ